MSGTNTRVIVGEADLRKPLTPEQKAEVDALRTMPDVEINFSDIPRLPRGWGKSAKRFDELFKPRKQAISLRIDADLLEWLKAGGEGWQTRMNSMIRDRMRAERRD